MLFSLRKMLMYRTSSLSFVPFTHTISRAHHSFENEWDLKRKRNGSWQTIEQGPPKGRNYGSKNTYIGGERPFYPSWYPLFQVCRHPSCWLIHVHIIVIISAGFCLSQGNYKFIITDLFKDGMCCDFVSEFMLVPNGTCLLHTLLTHSPCSCLSSTLGQWQIYWLSEQQGNLQLPQWCPRLGEEGTLFHSF